MEWLEWLVLFGRVLEAGGDVSTGVFEARLNIQLGQPTVAFWSWEAGGRFRFACIGILIMAMDSYV